MRVLKDSSLYLASKMDVGSEFHYLEAKWINELTNAFVRLLSNLIAYWC